jgi:hypothetical protein
MDYARISVNFGSPCLREADQPLLGLLTEGQEKHLAVRQVFLDAILLFSIGSFRVENGLLFFSDKQLQSRSESFGIVLLERNAGIELHMISGGKRARFADQRLIYVLYRNFARQCGVRDAMNPHGGEEFYESQIGRQAGRVDR